MSHSNSSLNQFLQCEKMYELNYIKHLKPPVTPSPHLTFGTMAHEVLYKAGKLRDQQGDNPPPEYSQIIPSEISYTNEATYFNITSWNKYFIPVVKEVAKIEKQLIQEFSQPCQIEREIKLQLTQDDLDNMGWTFTPENNLPFLTEPLVGVIDLLLYTATEAIIVDYKFSTKRKDQDDFDMNSQLYIYALFVHYHYDIPLHNIRIAYIDIPKQMFEMPAILTKPINGFIRLSRSKSQNCSQDMYIAAVKAIAETPEQAEQELAPGGYYYDIVNELALNKPAYLSIQYLDTNIYTNVITDILQTAATIELKNKDHLPYLRKQDSYSCKNCDYKSLCKPYLTEVFSNE